MREVPFMVLLMLGSQAAAQVPDDASVKQCIGALNAFEASIRRGGSTVKPEWVRAQRGGILMQLEMSRRARDAALSDYTSTVKDIAYCVSPEVSASEISLFLRAYHGYLGPDPLDGLSRCFAGFLIAAGELDRMLAPERAQAVGFVIGPRFGEVATQLNYLYGTKRFDLETVQRRATTIQGSVARAPARDRANAVNALIAQCGWFEIPLEGSLESVRAAAGRTR